MAYEPVIAAFRPSSTETCVAKITGLLAFGESHRNPKWPPNGTGSWRNYLCKSLLIDHGRRSARGLQARGTGQPAQPRAASLCRRHGGPTSHRSLVPDGFGGLDPAD